MSKSTNAVYVEVLENGSQNTLEYLKCKSMKQARELGQIYAAAPAMLDALKRAVKLARLDCKNSQCTCIQCGVKREMLAAIAKAKGQIK